MSPTDPLVSIVIPCHNAAPWLERTLESALAQTWPHREIIVVDDGSTDRSPEIARAFQSRGVRLLSQPNRGASVARNRALAGAAGAYIQFLDADDLLGPDKILRQVTLLRQSNGRFLASCAWGRFFDREDPASARFADADLWRDFAPADFLRLHFAAGRMMHPSAWLVPRGLAEAAGPWNEALSLNDDGEYFCRVLLASEGIRFAPEARSYYRSGVRGSLSRRRSRAALESQIRSLELCRGHVLRKEDSPEMRRALADAFQRGIYDLYPAPRALIRRAEQAVAELGGSRLKPEMGPATRSLSRLFGWKAVWRLKRMIGRRP